MHIKNGEVQGAGLVLAGEFEEILHEFPHANGFLFDAFHRLSDFLGSLQGSHAIQLRITANRHEGSAELMAGIAHKASHLVDGAGTVRERSVNSAKHGVQRSIEPADLRVDRGRAGQSLAEVTACNRCSRLLHLSQGLKRGRDEEAREEGAHDHNTNPEAQKNR